MKQQILSLGKNSIIYGFGSVLQSSITLLLMPLFTKYLTPEDYGVLSMLGILNLVARAVFSLGLNASLGPVYFEGNSEETKARAVWSAFLLHVISVSLMLVPAFICPGRVANIISLPDKHAWLVTLSILVCAASIITTALTSRLQFENRAVTYVLSTASGAIAATVLSAVFVVAFRMQAEGMILGQLSGCVFSLLLFLAVVLRDTPVSFSRAMMIKMIRLGIPMVPSFAFVFLLLNFNNFALEKYAGLDAVGIYSLGVSLGTAMSIVTSGVSAAWYPFFMGYISRQAEAKELFGRMLTLYVFLVGFVNLQFFIFAKPAVLLLTSDAFYDADLAIGFFASAYFFMGMYNFFLPGMYFREEIWAQSVIQAFAAMFSVPLGIILVQNFGVMGAAFGVALGHLLMVVFTEIWNLCRKDVYLDVRYEWRRIFLFSLLYVATASIFLTHRTNSFGNGIVFSLVGELALIVLMAQLFKPDEIRGIHLLRWLNVRWLVRRKTSSVGVR